MRGGFTIKLLKLVTVFFFFLVLSSFATAELTGSNDVCYNNGNPIDFSSLSWSQVTNFIENNKLYDAQNRPYVDLPVECAKGLKREMEWRGKTLSFLPAEWGYHKPSERLYLEVTLKELVKYNLQLNEKNNMTISDKEGNTLFNIVSSQDIYQMEDITLTNEWGYFGSGTGTDYIVSPYNLIQKGEYICIDEYTSIIKNSIPERIYSKCIFYPDIYFNSSIPQNSTQNWSMQNAVNITINKNKATINYPLPYDPLLNETSGLTFLAVGDLENNIEISDVTVAQTSADVTYNASYDGNYSNGSTYFNSGNPGIKYNKNSAFSTSEFTTCFSFEHSGTGNVYPLWSGNNFFMQCNSANQWYIRVYGLSDEWNDDSRNLGTCGNGDWYQGCVAYNGSNFINYLDGVYRTGDSTNGTIDLNSHEIHAGIFSQGHIEMIAFWDYALNESEMSTFLSKDNLESGCTPSYINSTTELSNSSCTITDYIDTNVSWVYYDENNCGASNETGTSIINIYTCDYCTPNPTNTSATTNSSSCAIDDTYNQDSYIIQYDGNTCYAITGLANDSYTNTTYWNNQTGITCNYCSYNLVYNSWSSYTNVTCGDRNRTFYDGNWAACCEVTGIASDCYASDTQLTNYTYTQSESLTCSVPASGEGLYLGVFVVLFCLSLFLIGYGYIIGEAAYIIVGLTFLFMLSTLVLIPNKVMVKNGEDVDTTYNYNASDDLISTVDTVTNEYTNPNTRFYGVWLSIIAGAGFYLVWNGVKGVEE